MSSSKESSNAEIWSAVNEPPPTPLKGRDRPPTQAVHEVVVDTAAVQKFVEEEDTFPPTPTTSGPERMWAKCKQEPLVPLGALTTAGILGLGLLSMGRGDRVAQQKLMRMRVGAQAFTLAAFTFGLYRMGTFDRKTQPKQ